MQGAGWIDILRRIPRPLHDTISFATMAGTEIMAQDILRLDNNYILLRGRLSGSQDAGKIIILPYDQIVNLVVNKVLKEKDVQEIFGGAILPPLPTPSGAGEAANQADDHAAEEAVDVGAVEEKTAEEAQEEGHSVGLSLSRFAVNGSTPQPANGQNGAPKPQEVSKSLLLARLRQRLADQGKKAP